MKISVSSRVFDEDISELYPYTNFHPHSEFFRMKNGNHYMLIAHIAKQFPQGTRFVDIGTFLGYSALALSINRGGHVVSYDLYDVREILPNDGKTLTVCDVPNVELLAKNCLDDIETLLSSPFIVLDVDPHDGKQEVEIITRLIENGYKGIVLCDDIHLNSGMKDFWNWVPLKKLDATHYGHWSGSGIIVFDPSSYDVAME